MPEIRLPLPDDCEILRVGTNAPSVDKLSGQVLRGAFLRREPHPETGQKRDSSGLSVNLKQKRSVRETQNDWPNCHMIAVLTTGTVRSIPVMPHLDVIQTAEDRDFHANITGLPERGPDVPEASTTEAERLATLLARASKVIYIRGKGFLEES